MQMLKVFLSTFIFAFILDMIWLAFIAKNIYAENIGPLLRKTGETMAPNWSAAMLVYLAIVTGILCFVLPKANGSYSMAFLWGALFGAVAYGIYDFTNFSILANWPLKITLIDFFWGMFLCGSIAIFANFIQKLVYA